MHARVALCENEWDINNIAANRDSILPRIRHIIHLPKRDDILKMSSFDRSNRFRLTCVGEVIISADSLKRRIQGQKCPSFMLDIANPKELTGLTTVFESTRYIALRKPAGQSPRIFDKHGQYSQKSEKRMIDDFTLCDMGLWDISFALSGDDRRPGENLAAG
jgi:hypothetical protein